MTRKEVINYLNNAKAIEGHFRNLSFKEMLEEKKKEASKKGGKNG